MRVALIGRYRVPYPFSEHRLDYPMLKEWARRLGYLHVLVCGSKPRAAIWQEGNLMVHYAPSGAILDHPPGFMVWAGTTLMRIHRQTPLDIVNGSDLWGGLVGLGLRPFIGVKVLAQLQDQFLPPSNVAYPGIRGPILHLIARVVCRGADKVRCLYQAAANQVGALGVQAEKIVVFPSRCDNALFDIGQFPPKQMGEYQLLYVGSLVRRKGLSVLLKALPEVAAHFPQVTLQVVGAGPEKAALQCLTAKLGLGSRVKFAGRVPHQELPALMREADLFVFPSFSEATPRAVMEALAMELPVVATRVGCLPEMIQDGETGFLVEPGDPRQLARAICKALDDPAWARTAGRLGREQILRHYTLEQHIDKMMALHYLLAEPKTSSEKRP